MAKEIKVLLTLDTRGFETGINRATRAVDGLKQKASGAGGAIGGLTNAVNAFIGSQIVGYVASTADSYTNLQNKVNAFSDSQAQANERMAEIQRVASATRSGLTETGQLYTRLSIAAKDLGLSQQEVGQITETFAKATKIGGATTQEAASAMLQFSQAMAAGKLNGDEFRSLMENSPVFMGKLREEVEKATGNAKVDLKKLASEGRITAETLAWVSLKMGKDIDEKFGKTVPTISERIVELQNKMISLFGSLENNTGIFSFISGAIGFLTRNLELLAIGMAIAFGPAALAMITKFFRTVQGLLVRNPFTAIAVAITLIIVALVDFYNESVKFRNALKSAANAGIEAVNVLIAGWQGFYAFLSTLLPAVASAIAAALNPFDNRTFIDTLQAGYTKAMSDARMAFASAPAIGFRFKMEDEKERKAKPGPEGDLPLGPAKEDKSGNRAAERIENARKKAEEYVQAIRDEITALNAKTESELKNIGVGELSKKLEEARLKNSEDYNEVVRKINSIENLSAVDRFKALTEAEALYKKLGITAQQSLKKIDAEQKAFAQSQAMSEIGTNADLARKEFDQMMQLDGEFNAAKKERMGERFSIENDFFARAASLRRQYKDQNDAELIGELANLDLRKTATLKAFDELTPDKLGFAETQRSFSYGWDQAYQEWINSTEDMAAYGAAQFANLTDGLTEAFTTFVMTGKLSFKSLINSILADVARMAAQNIVKGIFGAILGPSSTIFSSLFGGARASGGPVQAGKSYIVGERGPEMVRFGRAGTVIPNSRLMEGGEYGGGMTQVVYNISAVDAPSFKALVSQDPQFLYSVTQVGGRKAGAR